VSFFRCTHLAYSNVKLHFFIENLGGNNLVFPAKESLVSDIPAEDGNVANLFFTV